MSATLRSRGLAALASLAVTSCALLAADAPPGVGVGAKPPKGALLLLDGTQASLNANWTYWQGPGFASALPIRWKEVEDPWMAGGPS